jgi:hypothetical protein
MATRAHTVPKFYLNGFSAPRSERDRDPFVWVGSLTTGEVTKRSPKNTSISRGLYDGPGGFETPGTTIEAHLSKIESAASKAIRKFAAADIRSETTIPPELSRFLAWQAARTPGWMEAEQKWVDDTKSISPRQFVEPPPEGFDRIKHRNRPMLLEDPKTGERRHVTAKEEFETLQGQGWKWILSHEDRLELLHLQAWYFQKRHFPRLSWVRLHPPEDEYFITSDRGVAWIVDGYADTPPSVLKHPSARLFAPLTRQLALVGRHGTAALDVTLREVNRIIAFTASHWIAGPTAEVVRQALTDRHDPRH